MPNMPFIKRQSESKLSTLILYYIFRDLKFFFRLHLSYQLSYHLVATINYYVVKFYVEWGIVLPLCHILHSKTIRHLLNTYRSQCEVFKC